MRCLKEFAFEDIKVAETVAERPSFLSHGISRRYDKDHFCLRIDADEYDRDTFGRYLPIFRDNSRAVTIFFNVSAYVNAADAVLDCRKAGADIQSHGYYHHTYNDRANNFHNIKKADDFFRKNGIEVKAFAAPYGRWNPPLGRTLEELGYEYSSEFSYDYMGSPGYPEIGGRPSSVLQLPIFPVAPELFGEAGYHDTQRVIDYYEKAIDLMREMGIPVIVYAHINPKFADVPVILRGILEYALGQLKMTPANMSEICRAWKGMKGGAVVEADKKALSAEQVNEFFGRRKKISLFKELKLRVKDAADYDVVTPADEFQGGPWCRMRKQLLRGLLMKNT